MVFEGTTGVYERIYHFNFKTERNRNMRIRNGFEESPFLPKIFNDQAVRRQIPAGKNWDWTSSFIIFDGPVNV